MPCFMIWRNDLFAARILATKRKKSRYSWEKSRLGNKRERERKVLDDKNVADLRSRILNIIHSSIVDMYRISNVERNAGSYTRARRHLCAFFFFYFCTFCCWIFFSLAATLPCPGVICIVLLDVRSVSLVFSLFSSAARRAPCRESFPIFPSRCHWNRINNHHEINLNKLFLLHPFFSVQNWQWIIDATKPERNQPLIPPSTPKKKEKKQRFAKYAILSTTKILRNFFFFTLFSSIYFPSGQSRGIIRQNKYRVVVSNRRAN